MTDDTDDPGPEDGRLISLLQPGEVAYWTAALGVTRQELARAVDAVGHSAAKVRAWLKKTAPPTPGLRKPD